MKRSVLQTRMEKLVPAEFFIDAPHKQCQHRVFNLCKAVNCTCEPSLLECGNERFFRRKGNVPGQFASDRSSHVFELIVSRTEEGNLLGDVGTNVRKKNAFL
jgi:hypothetical protein